MTENLMTAFELLGVGWGGIFVVMIVIYLVSLGLAKPLDRVAVVVRSPLKSLEALRSHGCRRGAVGIRTDSAV